MRCHLSLGRKLAGALAAAALAMGCAGSGQGVDPTEALDAARVCKNGKGDCTPPIVSITSPSSGVTVSGTLTVAGTASDAALKSVSVMVDGIVQNGVSGVASWSISIDSRAFADGAHTVSAVATDTARNTATAAVQITISNGAGPSTVPSNAPPTVWIDAPASGATVSGALSVAGRAADDVGVARVEVQVDGGTWRSASGTTSWTAAIDTTTVTNGTHTIAARATDTAGQQTTASISVTVSNATSTGGALAIAITSPSGGATVSGTTTITGTASGATRVQVRFDSLAYIDVAPLASWSYTFNSAALANGPHSVTASVTDASGTSKTIQLSIYVSNVDAPPTIVILTPAAGATVSGLYHVSGFVFDINGNGQAQVAVDAGTYKYTNGFGYFEYDLDTTQITNGTHTLSVRASDDLGTTGAASKSFVVSNGDVTRPTVAITSPSPGATVSGNITVSGTASDETGLARVDVRDSYQSFRTAAGTSSWSFTVNTRGLANGSHTFIARAVDTTGNVATASVTFTVANGPSNESLVTPEGVHITVNTVAGFSAAEIYRILKENAYQLSVIGPMLTVIVDDKQPLDYMSGGCSVGSCSFTIGLNGAGGTFPATPALDIAHEYGHVWSYFHVLRTDAGDWTAYLHARGLDVDPRLDSTADMSKAEIAADDHRIVFGSPDAQLKTGHRYVEYPTMDPALKSWFTTHWAN
jgi:Bacterial Ig domain